MDGCTKCCCQPAALCSFTALHQDHILGHQFFSKPLRANAGSGFRQLQSSAALATLCSYPACLSYPWHLTTPPHDPPSTQHFQPMGGPTRAQQHFSPLASGEEGAHLAAPCTLPARLLPRRPSRQQCNPQNTLAHITLSFRMLSPPHSSPPVLARVLTHTHSDPGFPPPWPPLRPFARPMHPPSGQHPLPSF